MPRRAVKEGIFNDVLYSKNNKSNGNDHTKRHPRCYDDASDSGVLGVQKENGNSSSIHCGGARDGSGGGSGSGIDASSEDDEPDD